MKGFPDIFRDLKTRYDKQPARDPELVCREGFHMDCHVLKLQKPAWTNDDLRSIRNPTGGIFFSIWITAEGEREGRAEYNIHAIQLRFLKQYRISANDFCREFRAAFEDVRPAWPNVSTSSGCLTLMQGWFAINQKAFARDALALMNRFKGVASIVDRLLEKRLKVIVGK